MIFTISLYYDTTMDFELPTYEYSHSNGVVRLQKWTSYRHNHLPTYISYDKEGNVIEVRWMLGSNYYRKDYGPSMISFHSNGVKASEAWYVTSMGRQSSYLDRRDGPAVSFYKSDGTVVFEQYWIEGVEKSLAEWKRIVE